MLFLPYCSVLVRILIIVGTGTTVQTDLDIKRIIEHEIGAREEKKANVAITMCVRMSGSIALKAN